MLYFEQMLSRADVATMIAGVEEALLNLEQVTISLLFYLKLFVIVFSLLGNASPPKSHEFAKSRPFAEH